VPPGPATLRAARLLRWYPRSWRARYADEFAELLIADIEERPRSWARAADVARCGVAARLHAAGLAGPPLEPAEQVRSSLAALGCALGAFLAFGLAIWSQLTIGWQWSRPDAPGTVVAMVLMSAAALLLFALAVLGAVPVAWCALRAARRREWRAVRPALLAALGAAALGLGGRSFGARWPGTHGHPWAAQGLVPPGIGAFAWALTRSVTAYWAHPGALRSFSAAEIAWMAVSPLAMLCLVAGVAGTVRRLHLPPPVLRYEARLATMAAAGMVAFLLGACCWVVVGGPGPRGLFRTGTVDVAGLAVMTAALAVGWQASERARRAGGAVLRR
jgi:hypothetical protein